MLLVLAFIPSLVISFNITYMDLIDTYQLPFTWLRLRFAEDYVCLDRPHDHLWRMVSCPLDSPLGASGGVAL